MRIQVKVQPESSKEEVVKGAGGGLKVYLKASPVDGKANLALIRILAEYFDVKKSVIRIITGKTSSKKIIEVGF